MTLIKFTIRLVYFLTFVLGVPITIYSQGKTDSASFFKDLTSFQNPGKEWGEVADVQVTPGLSGNFRKTSGTGIIVTNAVKGETELTTSTKFSDIELEFDFLLGKGAISALLLQGRYLLNLSDSWSANETSFNSMGGIGKQNQIDSSGFSAAAPLINAAKAPGLWQHVRIRFRAPQFTGNNKTSNALLEEVYINECLVQQNIELQGGLLRVCKVLPNKLRVR